MSPQQIRGKLIYTKGTGQNPVSAYLSGPDIKMPAESFPCIQCHKEDGRGTREGGVLAPDIRFSNLQTPSTGNHPTGRSFSPYTEETLGVAIQQGTDPAGNTLHPAMPRYTMEQPDLDDLVAYLKILGNEPVPGITNDLITVGTVIPSRGPLAETGLQVVRVLKAYFAERNERGGMFGRKFELVPIEFDPGEPGSALTAVKDRLSETPVFCMVANLGLPPKGEVMQWLNSEHIPVLAPLVITPDQPYTLSNSTFYLYSSLTEQARVLMDHLAELSTRPDPGIAIIYADDMHSPDAARGVRRQNGTYQFNIVWDQSYPIGKFNAGETVRSMRDKNPQAVFFFGHGQETVDFIQEANRQNWHPRIFGLMELAGASLLSQQLPDQFSGEIFIASPISPPNPNTREFADFVSLLKKNKIQPKSLAFQYSAFAGGILLEEGLKLSGRHVTRNRMIDETGKIWQLATGVTPELTYNDNRREGSVGAAISRLDLDGKKLKIVPARNWKEPKEADK